VWRVRRGIETRAVTRRRDAMTGTRGTRRVRSSAEMRWFAVSANLARRRTFRGLVNDVGGSGWTPCDAGRARDEDAARSRSIASSSPPRITL